jgi:hypothetical protein
MMPLPEHTFAVGLQIQHFKPDSVARQQLKQEILVCTGFLPLLKTHLGDLPKASFHSASPMKNSKEKAPDAKFCSKTVV